jgi:hypothetical protein
MNTHSHGLTSLPFKMLSNIFDCGENIRTLHENQLRGALRIVAPVGQETWMVQSSATNARTMSRMNTYAYN